MAAYKTDSRKVVKCSTVKEDSVNNNHSKFGVSNNSLTPPLVQSFTHFYVNNFLTVSHKIKIKFFLWILEWIQKFKNRKV